MRPCYRHIACNSVFLYEHRCTQWQMHVTKKNGRASSGWQQPEVNWLAKNPSSGMVVNSNANNNLDCEIWKYVSKPDAQKSINTATFWTIRQSVKRPTFCLWSDKYCTRHWYARWSAVVCGSETVKPVGFICFALAPLVRITDLFRETP